MNEGQEHRRHTKARAPLARLAPPLARTDVLRAGGDLTQKRQVTSMNIKIAIGLLTFAAVAVIVAGLFFSTAADKCVPGDYLNSPLSCDMNP